MISHKTVFLYGALVVASISCGGSDSEPTPDPAAAIPPTIVLSPASEPTIVSEPTVVTAAVETPSLPTVVPEPAPAGILNEVPDAFDFVREGVYRASDGVGGAAWLDYDNDGDLDLYVANAKTESNGLFRNDGGGSFVNVAQQAGVTNGEGNSGVAAADINNDGCADLFLSGEGGAIGTTWSPHKLYVNNCDGTFTDVSESSGIVIPEGVWSAAFGDLNGDTYLDLFVGGVSGLFGGDIRPGPNEIFLNNGDNTFTPISMKAGIATRANTCGVAISDHDEDGLPDLFIANCGGGAALELLRNSGDLTFTDIALDAGLAEIRSEAHQTADARSATKILFADYDLDQDLDILALSYGNIAPVEWIQHSFFENNGDATYTNVADQAGIKGLSFGWGAAFADFDNDGYPDIYHVGQFPISPYDFLGGNPGTLYLNQQDGTFAKEESRGLDGLFTSGLATADYDNDGYLDIVVVTAKSRGEGGMPVLLRNRGGDNAWITLRLVGTDSNRDAVGARVTVSAGDARLLKEIRSGFAFLATESPWPTFGLAQHDGPVDVEVKWPSGLSEIFENQPIRQIVTLTEGTGTR